MNIDIDIESLNVEESPCTLAYLMLALLSGVYGYTFAVDDTRNKVYVVDDDGILLFTISVAGVFAQLLVAVLNDIDSQLSDGPEEDDDNPWNSLIS